MASMALDVLMAARDELPQLVELPKDRLSAVSAWDSISAPDDAGRPGLRDLLRYSADVVMPLSGTGEGEQDDNLLICLARFGATPCLVIGHDRRGPGSRSTPGPAGLRQARRGMRLAEELRLPLVSVIETSGAELSQAAEEGGWPPRSPGACPTWSCSRRPPCA